MILRLIIPLMIFLPVARAEEVARPKEELYQPAQGYQKPVAELAQNEGFGNCKMRPDTFKDIQLTSDRVLYSASAIPRDRYEKMKTQPCKEEEFDNHADHIKIICQKGDPNYYQIRIKRPDIVHATSIWQLRFSDERLLKLDYQEFNRVLTKEEFEDKNLVNQSATNEDHCGTPKSIASGPSREKNSDNHAAARPTKRPL
jgi:hypothetical protein